MAKNDGGKREQQIKITYVTVRALTSKQFEKCVKVLGSSSPCKPVVLSFTAHMLKTKFPETLKILKG